MWGLLSNYNLKLVLIEHEKKIQIEWEREEGIVVALDFGLLSEGLRLLILHLAAIFTNKNKLICFEEPESHTFPYYTKLLAEIVAGDKDNQYIITTHNPYFLLNIIENTRPSDIAVYIANIKNHATSLYMLSDDELPELLDMEMDLFFNLERFIE